MQNLNRSLLDTIKAYLGLQIVLMYHWTKLGLMNYSSGNEVLVEKFTEEEVKNVIFQMEHNKAPGPDGFPPEFYQVF